METLSDWVRNNFTELVLVDIQRSTNQATGATVTRIPSKVNVELTAALLSCSNKDEFTRVALHFAPVGVIVDEIPDEFYLDKLLLLKTELTRVLLRQDSNKALCERYLGILERRDSANWSKVKDTKVQVTQDNVPSGTLSINFVQVG